MYLTVEDMIAAYGADELSYVADRDGDRELDPAVIEAAISSAAAIIDSHIGARYPLPLASVPDVLRELAKPISIYKLTTNPAALTEEHRQQYEDAIAHLKRIADGKAVLVFPVDDTAADSDDGSNSSEDIARSSGPRPVVASGPERVFSREKMRGL